MSGEIRGITPEVYKAIVEIVDARMKEIKTAHEDFVDLRRTVEEADLRSERRMTRLEEAMADLAEAQKETRQELKELAAAQKRTEQVVAETRQELKELAEAQKRDRKSVV
jgi:chromosome segregation ATPase